MKHGYGGAEVPFLTRWPGEVTFYLFYGKLVRIITVPSKHLHSEVDVLSLEPSQTPLLQVPSLMGGVHSLIIQIGKLISKKLNWPN